LITIDPSTLGPHFESREAEEKWGRQWAEWDVYRYDPRSTNQRFMIDTPPPTVSGSLHVGHVFSFTQTDVIARHQRMRGREVCYPMGWDDNGLPTERRVQNYYHVRCEPHLPYEPDLKIEAADDARRKERPRLVSRANFIDLCLALTKEDEQAFKALWERLALSVDWRLEYSTINEHARRIAQLSFLDLFRKQHVYNLEAPTMWDVDFRTAVAQAEVEDRPVKGAFHHIRFGVEGSERSFTIATTRPELLPACVGVAAHPDDERYKDLFGQNAITPLFRAPVRIFPTTLADPTKGTGILMVCTFGDATDVQWWREEKLPLRQIIGLDGRLLPIEFGTEVWPSTDAVAANGYYAQLAGKTIKESQRLIVELLRDPNGAATAEGPALTAEPQPLEHPVKFFEKGDRPLEYITTRQWFVRLLDKKDQLVEQGERIQWHPDFMRTRYRNWTENLQIDWCISRQRYFGVSFPVWFPIDAAGRSEHARPIVADESTLPIDPMIASPPGFTEAQRDQPGGFRAESDVFDTWFTSSLTPQLVTGWTVNSGQPPILPMDLRPQSHEIIRTWAFYTIAKALLHEGQLPWKHVAISGWVLDPDRKKMSKSKGNVLTPMHLLDNYGSDAVRYWSLSAKLGVDTAFDEKVLKVGRRLVVKLWNASKLVLSLSAPDVPVSRPLDLAFLARLGEVVERASALMDDFEYATALDAVERCFWGSFTDTYVELVKVRARSEDDPEGRGSAVHTLQFGLKTLLRLFAPFLPYVTEECWSWGFAAGETQPSIHRAPWPTAGEFTGFTKVAAGGALFDTAVAFQQAVHRGKTAGGASVGRQVQLLKVAANPATAARLEQVRGDALSAARVERYEVEPREGLADDTFELLALELAPAAPPAGAPDTVPA
jgi:valyl-tRNA synthetase